VEHSIHDAHVVEIEPDIVPSHSDLLGRRTEDREVRPTQVKRVI
jgi:hypothetical protein